MAELTAEDVSTFTGGRLPNDESTEALLAAALTAARRYCGWHVSPVREDDEVRGDAEGSLLALPTLKLVALQDVSEDGDSVDLLSLLYAVPTGYELRRALITKVRGCWSRSVTATITHGLTEAEAADWRRAVLRLVDAMSYETVTTRDDPTLVRKKIDDVEYEWAEGLISSDERLQTLLYQFRILPSP